MRATGFLPLEVAQFRDCFLSAHVGQSQSSAPVELSFQQFWKMISSITVLGTALTQQLREIFYEADDESRSRRRCPGGVRGSSRDFVQFSHASGCF